MNEIREKEIKNKIYRGLEQYIYTLEQNYNSSRILCMQKHREQIISWSEKKIYSRKLVGSEKKNQEQNISWSGTIYMYTRTKL